MNVIDSDKRLITGYASTSHLDRTNDIVQAEGVTLPIGTPVLSGHDHAKPVGVVRTVKKTKDHVLATVELLPAGQSADADLAWQNVKFGSVANFSIGFIPEEGQPNEHGGMTFSKVTCHELSLVPVPANPHAKLIGRTEAKSAATPKAAVGTATTGKASTPAQKTALAALMATYKQ